jgi:hypothetical protein
MPKIHTDLLGQMNYINSDITNDNLHDAREKMVECIGRIDAALGGETEIPEAPEGGEEPKKGKGNKGNKGKK